MTGCYINPFGESGKQLVDDVRTLRENLYGKQNPCRPPGANQAQKCFFSLTITNPDFEGNLVRGHVSTKACDQNKNSGNSSLDCTSYPYDNFGFEVKGHPTLMQHGDYDFDSEGGGSAILVCRDRNGQPTTTDCWNRDRGLDTVTGSPGM
jgi:hypothetical protein